MHRCVDIVAPNSVKAVLGPGALPLAVGLSI